MTRSVRARVARSTTVFACAVTIAIGTGACGRKTAVRAPELVAPQPVAALEVRNVERGVELAWDRPTRYADGATMLDLAGFRVERSRPCCGFLLHQEIEIEDRQRFRRAKRIRWTDDRVQLGEEYAYRITAYTIDGYESEPVESPPIVRELPPPTP